MVWNVGGPGHVSLATGERVAHQVPGAASLAHIRRYATVGRQARGTGVPATPCPGQSRVARKRGQVFTLMGRIRRKIRVHQRPDPMSIKQ